MTMQADQLMGAQVTGSDGQPVGIVDEVFRDDVVGTPSWVRVRSGGRQHMVPLGGSIITTRGLSVPFDARKIADEPVMDIDRHLSAAQEEQLRGYFGIALPADPAGEAWTPANWAGHTQLSESRLADVLPGESRWGETSFGQSLSESSGESRWGETSLGESRLGDVLPGESRWGETQPGEPLGGSRWGETSLGQSRLGDVLPGESRWGKTQPGEPLRESQRGETSPGEARAGESLGGSRWGETSPGEARAGESLGGSRWGETSLGESRLGDIVPSESRWGETTPGEPLGGARRGETRLGETRWSDAQVGESRWSETQPGRGGQAAPNHTVITGRQEASSPDNEGWLILTEERLEVETEVVESGRVRLHRYVDTEPVERVVHLFHEEYEVEHIPIVPGEPVGDSDGEQELILHEKRAVFVKQTVPVERVRLSARRIEEDKTFRAEIRRERIEIETQPTRPGTERSGI